MKVWGVSVERVTKAVEFASAKYDGNIIFKASPIKDGRAIRFTLTVKDVRKKGARRSANGRRVNAACWHCHRDVILAIFTRDNGARVKTAIADYKGFEDFCYKYPDTASNNDACNCKE